MTSSSEQDSNGNAGGGGARAITRGEEARVRAAIRDALNVYPSGINLYWSHDDKRMTSISIDSDGQRYRDLTVEEVAKVGRAGIVPGPEGWCWAPVAPVTRGDCRWNARCTFADKHSGPCSCAEEPQAPPAWLTAAVLAALPASGESVHLDAIIHAAQRCPESGGAVADRAARAAIDALVASGEIECDNANPEWQWRRWGVPEGWSDWTVDDDGASNIACLADPHIAARAYRDGEWKVWDGQSYSPQWQGRANPGRLANAKRAALQTCHLTLAALASRRLAPTLTTSTPQGAGMGEQVAIAAAVAGAPTRAEQVRAALLAVLQRGPVEGGASRVLLALDAEGTRDVTIAEARAAAREVGAVVDGARWSLPAMPPGWGWRRLGDGDGLFLAPLDAINVVDTSIAMASPKWWETYKAGPGERVIEQADCASVKEGQAIALLAARRAGLFARPAPVEVTGAGGPAVLPAVTSQSGEAVVKVAPATLASGQALASHIERMVGIREGQGDCSLARLIEAFAAGIEERAVRKALDLDAQAGRALAEAAEARDATAEADPRVQEARALLEAERAVTAKAIAATAEAHRERDDARTQMAIEAARADRAESSVEILRARLLAAEEQAHKAEQERDAARAELAALQAGLDGLRTWATDARGGAK